MKRLSFSLALAAVLALTACGGSEPPAPGPNLESVSLKLEVDAGTVQAGESINALVTATDPDTGSPVAGVLVNFVDPSGGSVFAGSAVTNSQGQAREVWSPSTSLGAHVLEARAVDQTTGEPEVLASVTVTVVPGDPVQAMVNPDYVQVSATYGVPMSNFSVRAWDAYSHEVAITQGLTFTGFTPIQSGQPGSCNVSGGYASCSHPGGWLLHFNTDFPGLTADLYFNAM